MATQTRSSLIFLPAILLFIITSTTTSQSQTQQQKSNFDICAPFNCGNINFSFPFFPSSAFGTSQFYCGLPRFQIACDPSSSIPSIELSGRLYQVKELFSSDHLVTVVDNQLIDKIRLDSCTSLQNLSISITDGTAGNAVLGLPVEGVNLTIFECPNGNSLPTGYLDQVVGNYNCHEGNRVYIWAGTRTGNQVHSRLVPTVETPVGCKYVSLPLSGAGLQKLNRSRAAADGVGAQTLLADVLSFGFQLKWPNITGCQICELTGGRCGYDVSSQKIDCFCQGGCNKQKKSNRWKFIVGISSFLKKNLANIEIQLNPKHPIMLQCCFEPISLATTQPEFTILCLATNHSFLHQWTNIRMEVVIHANLTPVINEVLLSLGQRNFMKAE